MLRILNRRRLRPREDRHRVDRHDGGGVPAIAIVSDTCLCLGTGGMSCGEDTRAHAKQNDRGTLANGLAARRRPAHPLGILEFPHGSRPALYPAA